MRNRFSKHLSCVLCAVLVTVALLGSSTVALSQGTEKILEVWRPSNNEAIEGFWQAQVDAFNTQYAGQYKVVQSTFPKSGDQGYSNKVSAAVLSQTLPDLMLVDGPNVSNYAINEMIIPLDSYISAESKADLLDSIITQGTYNEKLYAVGLWESSVALFYNKTLLAEAGIEAPTTLEDAWTWSELLEVAKKLTTPERYGITFHNEIGEQVTYFYSPMVVENGLDLVSPDGSTATGYLNSDATLKAIQTLKGFYDAKVANVAPTATEFHDGKSAMLLGGAHQIGNLAKYPDVDWGLTYYPAADDGTLKCPTGSWAFAITSNAKDPDGAWLFLDWMTNTKANIAGCTASGNLPNRHSSAEALPTYNEYPRSMFVEMLSKCGAPRPRTPVYALLSNQFTAAVSDMLAGVDILTKLNEGAKIVDDDYAMNYK